MNKRKSCCRHTDPIWTKQFQYSARQQIFLCFCNAWSLLISVQHFLDFWYQNTTDSHSLSWYFKQVNETTIRDDWIFKVSEAMQIGLGFQDVLWTLETRFWESEVSSMSEVMVIWYGVGPNTESRVTARCRDGGRPRADSYSHCIVGFSL